MSLLKRTVAEMFGTFWLVFLGCGAAVISAGIPNVGIGYIGVGLAFGLALLTMAFAHRPHLRLPPEPCSLHRTGGTSASPPRS